MTDNSQSVRTITGHDYAATSLQRAAPIVDNHRHHNAAQADGQNEDDGLIRCFCGYDDDDGWTVQCDHCKIWQHQVCYYPEYEDRALPEALQHYCVDCQPRAHDATHARLRQKLKREGQAAGVNGIKRPPSKSHKKKVKEPGYTNGWPLDKARHDRTSASPRDLPPPAKRPKTSHRASDSITNGKGHSRKRTASNVNHSRSLSRSPDIPLGLYSDQFTQSYRDDSWQVIDVNLHNSIHVSNRMSDWLNASEESFRREHGHEKTEALNRWDGNLDDIPGKAQIDIRSARDERALDTEGNVPEWRWVTVQESVAPGAYIGELKGHVGFKDEYMKEECNRWSLLRHPEPFVFFHPILPIHVDAREEGTDLRYIRRSCQPNARLQILVTNSTDYRFCFMATQQIDPGMEISLAWDTRDGVSDSGWTYPNDLMTGDLDHLSAWVSSVLANCGPCACSLSAEQCMMARFDRRGIPSKPDPDHHQQHESTPFKVPKAKKRKGAQHISPLDTHVASRSGSEARRLDGEDDPSDSRSPSASVGRPSASRDNTPHALHSHNSMSAITELSERERKKLAKEEEMFRRQEEEQTGNKGKKKRNSGGSNLTTPSATSSKQLGFPGSSKYADAGVSRQIGLPSAKTNRQTKSAPSLKSPLSPLRAANKRPKPEYTHSGVQCDMDKEEEGSLIDLPLRQKRYVSTTQRLLQRCALNNAKRREKHAINQAKSQPDHVDAMDIDEASPDVRQAENPIAAIGQARDLPQASSPMPEPLMDAGMTDGVSLNAGASDHSRDARKQQEQIVVPEHPKHGSAEIETSPKAPPIDGSNLVFGFGATHPDKAANMHVNMPPPFAPATSSWPDGTPNSITGSASVMQSPMSVPALGSLFSPAVNAAVTPSPARKKMSLSDYTKRNKAKDKDVEPKGDRESSPASNTDAAVVPPLHPTSSDLAGARESSTAVEDDVKMEDVVEPPAAGIPS